MEKITLKAYFFFKLTYNTSDNSSDKLLETSEASMCSRLIKWTLNIVGEFIDSVV